VGRQRWLHSSIHTRPFRSCNVLWGSGNGHHHDPSNHIVVADTQSFGDFPDSFYQGYNDEWPLPDDYLQRRDLYDLYHVLNHANMFGGCYVDSVYTILSELIEA